MATRRRIPTGRHSYPRSARLSETLREVLADELVRIDDERLELVTITGIDVDNELNRAVVFFDSLAGESGDEAIIEVLEQHRRRMQASINRQIRAKKTPILDFRPDEVIRAAERIDEILRSESPRSPATQAGAGRSSAGASESPRSPATQAGAGRSSAGASESPRSPATQAGAGRSSAGASSLASEDASQDGAEDGAAEATERGR